MCVSTFPPSAAPAIEGRDVGLSVSVTTRQPAGRVLPVLKRCSSLLSRPSNSGCSSASTAAGGSYQSSMLHLKPTKKYNKTFVTDVTHANSASLLRFGAPLLITKQEKGLSNK
uniref:Uncharacterized protein n=1 Tax=Zea mays TaxID=4577 RepID=A0A804NCT8_MAIZE